MNLQASHQVLPSSTWQGNAVGKPPARPVGFGVSNDTVTFSHQSHHGVQFGNEAPDRTKATEWKQKGNEAHYNRNYKGAISAYKKAIEFDNTYVDAWFNLGHTYTNIGKFKDAATAFYTLLAYAPDDHEARIKLVEQLLHMGKDRVAISHLDDLQRTQPDFDPARRLNGYHRLLYWSQKHGKPIQPVINNLGAQNLSAAKTLLTQYTAYLTQQGQPLPAKVSQAINNTKTEFYPTTQIDYVPNLAEYHHRTAPQQSHIRFSPQMAFAHPAVLAAYWLHEGIHAADNDPLTSVVEEQDAYRAKIGFWQWYTQTPSHPTVTDPNLDYATRLYAESPNELNNKVALHYRTRNPSIPPTSPNHPPTATLLKPSAANGGNLPGYSQNNPFVTNRVVFSSLSET